MINKLAVLSLFAVLLTACAHRPVTLAEIQAVNVGQTPVKTQSSQSAFQWSWQSSETQLQAITRFNQWLAPKTASAMTACLTLPTNEQRVALLMDGWGHARRFQQIALAQGVELFPAVCGASKQPVLEISVRADHDQ